MNTKVCPHCSVQIPIVNSNSFNNHTRWCVSTGERGTKKFLLFCSCIECKQVVTKQNINSHYAKHFVVKLPKLCPWCGNEHLKEGKFCNNSCAASYTNRKKDYSLIKTGPKPNPRTKSNKEKRHQPKILKDKDTQAPYTKLNVCVICNKYHAKKSQTCSGECKSDLLSRRIKNSIANGYDPNTNRGRGKRSYLEESFNQWLKDNYPNLLYFQEYSFRRLDTIKTYFADFYFPSLQLIIELDGSQHTATQEYDRERDQYIESTYGLTILRITHKEYKQKTKLDLVNSLLQN